MSPIPPTTSTRAPPNKMQRRSYWLKQLHQWHWISAALCLVAMLLFAGTGITLNHAAQIGAQPQISTRKATLSQPMLEILAVQTADTDTVLPAELRDWLVAEIDVSAGDRLAEWSEDEIYLALPRPGGDAWLSIDRVTGAVEYERTDRGWIAYFNDLHKGRNTGGAWSWFIDLFAVTCVVFCVTGFFLLQMHAKHRPSTWPVVGLGVLSMLLVAVFFIH